VVDGQALQIQQNQRPFAALILKWPGNSQGQVVAQDSILLDRGFPIRRRLDSPAKIENAPPR
jgi:hypothetical protein